MDVYRSGHLLDAFQKFLDMTNLYFARWTVLQATPNTGITIQCCFVRDPNVIPAAILEKNFRSTLQ